MSKTQTIATTCPYCGVGCGVMAQTNGSDITVKGDGAHPANFGRLCSKGAALAETLSLEDRLLVPKVDGEEVSWPTAINAVAHGFANIINTYGSDAVAFYVSGQLLTEDYYVANKLMKGFIGSANIDTNSRLCMSSTVAGHKRAFGTDSVPCSYEDLELAELFVLVGSNTAWCHPVLYQRINQAKQQNPQKKVIVIDPRRTATCDLADLHLPIRPGSDVWLFNGLMRYLIENEYSDFEFIEHATENAEALVNSLLKKDYSLVEVAEQTGLSAAQLKQFFTWFAETPQVVSVFSQGVNQSSQGVDKVNAIINCHLFTGRIGKPGMGPFSFTGQPNAMGGREVGGLANQLAIHRDLDNPAHRQAVQHFWQSPLIADQPGLKAVELFEAIDQGRIKALWIMATNPLVSLPDSEQVRAALQKCELVVVSDMSECTDTARAADIVLPALGWGEKDGTVTNSERRISRQRAFLQAPGEARADWWIISEVARAMGFAEAFDYSSPAEIFREYAKLSGLNQSAGLDFDISGLAQLSDQAYQQLQPIQWPVNQANPLGTARLFGDGRFFTASQRARFIDVHPVAPANAPDKDYPFVLNTGRVRDQWHTMTRTGKTPRLSEHSPEPYVQLRAGDASGLGLVDGSLAKITSRWGAIIVRVNLSEEGRAGEVFVPMHWNDEFAKQARVNSLVNPVVDPLSGQPELKHTPVKVQAYEPAWHGFLLSRRRLDISDSSYWVRATGDGFYRYEIAGEQQPADWADWARGLLCADDDEVNWVEYLDVSARRYRGVRLTGNCVESCLFIAPGHALPSRDWLGSLFGKPTLSDTERVALLSGRAPHASDDKGRIVCACFAVGINTIVDAIREQNLTSAEQIGAALQAGTNCGSCVPELKALLAEVADLSAA